MGKLLQFPLLYGGEGELIIIEKVENGPGSSQLGCDGSNPWMGGAPGKYFL